VFYSTPFLSLLTAPLILLSLFGCATHYKQVSLQEDYLLSVHKLSVFVIPASEASRESFLNKDSGQAGMTENDGWAILWTDTNY